MKRSRTELIHDILRAVQDKGGKIKPTHLLYKANLSHGAMQKYVQELSTAGFLTLQETRDGPRYVLTDHGYQFLNEYQKFKDFAESFGL